MMSCVNGGILRRSPQSLARQSYIVPRAEVSILGVDIDAISADPLRIAAIFLLVLFGLRDEVFSLVVRIPAYSVQGSEGVAY